MKVTKKKVTKKKTAIKKVSKKSSKLDVKRDIMIEKLHDAMIDTIKSVIKPTETVETSIKVVQTVLERLVGSHLYGVHIALDQPTAIAALDELISNSIDVLTMLLEENSEDN